MNVHHEWLGQPGMEDCVDVAENGKLLCVEFRYGDISLVTFYFLDLLSLKMRFATLEQGLTLKYALIIIVQNFGLPLLKRREIFLHHIIDSKMLIL
jgi:hypothetical protein